MPDLMKWLEHSFRLISGVLALLIVYSMYRSKPTIGHFIHLSIIVWFELKDIWEGQGRNIEDGFSSIWIKNKDRKIKWGKLVGWHHLRYVRNNYFLRLIDLTRKPISLSSSLFPSLASLSFLSFHFLLSLSKYTLR